MCCSTLILYASTVLAPILRAFSILWLPSIKLYFPGAISAIITGTEISTESMCDSLIDENLAEKSLTITSSRVKLSDLLCICSRIFVILNSKIPLGYNSSPTSAGYGVKSLSTFNFFHQPDVTHSFSPPAPVPLAALVPNFHNKKYLANLI
jgi:hypothetical protein